MMTTYQAKRGPWQDENQKINLRTIASLYGSDDALSLPMMQELEGRSLLIRTFSRISLQTCIFCT
jgi:hypothetical protein